MKKIVMPSVRIKKTIAEILVSLTSFCSIVLPLLLPKNVSAPPEIAPERPAERLLKKNNNYKENRKNYKNCSEYILQSTHNQTSISIFTDLF